MRMFIVLILAAKLSAQLPCSVATEGWDWSNGSRLNGFKWFPNSRIWQPVTSTPVHANTATYYDDFSAGGVMMNWSPFDRSARWLQVEGYNPNVELMVVDGGKQPRVFAFCGGYASEPCYDPDPLFVPVPIPMNPRVQAKCGAPGQGCPGYNSDGDKHTIILDKRDCVFYDIYNVHVTMQGKIFVASLSIFDALGGDTQRPFSWTSGSHSGFHWWGGTIRYEEIANGVIDHAIGMIGFGGGGNNTKYAETSFATHTGPSWNSHSVPYGTRIRLKSSVNISGYHPQSQIILQALKTYGAYVLDGGGLSMVHEGSNFWDYPGIWDFTSASLFTAANFDFLEHTGPIANGGDYPPTWPTGTAPAFTSFTVNDTAGDITIAPGAPVTLAWTTTGTNSDNDLALIDWIGVVRGATKGSVTINPTTSITYYVRVTNEFGQTASAPRTVTVTGTRAFKNPLMPGRDPKREIWKHKPDVPIFPVPPKTTAAKKAVVVKKVTATRSVDRRLAIKGKKYPMKEKINAGRQVAK